MRETAASDLGAAVIKATLERAKLDGSDVGTVVMGQVVQPAFCKDGTSTAGNAPGLNSGAAAMGVAANAKWAEKRGIEPFARLVSYGVGAVEPGLFGLGPIPAVRQALDRAGWRSSEFDAPNPSSNNEGGSHVD